LKSANCAVTAKETLKEGTTGMRTGAGIAATVRGGGVCKRLKGSAAMRGRGKNMKEGVGCCKEKEAEG